MGSDITEAALETALQLAELTAIDDVERLQPEWTALAERCPWATPFQLPEWQLAWWRNLGGGELRVVTLRRGGRLVALAPLFRHGYDWEPHRLSMLATGISDYEDFIFEPDIAVKGTELIFRHLAGPEPGWDVCELRELRPNSPILTTMKPPRLCVEVGVGSICPVLELPATTVELHARLSTRFRRTLRMVSNRLRKGGAVEYVTADGRSMPELVDALFRLHELRWNKLDEPGVLVDPRLRRFHEDVAAGMLKSGRLRLYGLRLNGAIIAVLYGFAFGGRMYSYLTGLDPTAGYYSPGINLLRHAIETAIAGGDREFDMLRGEEQYKYLWGSVARPNYGLTMRRADGDVERSNCQAPLEVMHDDVRT